ncbi:DNA-binding response regulator [Anaerobacillus arseniciselenatis]|uniref:DNA-binding response regulator n=1 Tax=Anaerobacillus arseniciselenatis TaxID=85682 RepID=A0A1S2L5V6_9BACI|nr:response regulator transcription factor [Anaerobacillus arseniciselenatis]OIJ07694.1 DNA-binding response regulator [Anaerobacillus arseniciselenatis]
MNEGKKILVVDDEPKILKVLEQTLTKQNYEVITASDGEEALLKLEEKNPDLMVLDLMLPKLDGYEVCRLAKSKTNIPIIMLTAKGDLVDKTVGFHMGIDDYMTKPFSPSELALRIKAVMRRVAEAQLLISRSQSQSTSPQTSEPTLELGGVKIDFNSRQIEVNGTVIKSTAKEFELLKLFMQHPNQVFTREQLLQKIWDSDYVGDANTVTVLIRRIREKLEDDPAKPTRIVTVWGVGYKFATD